MEYIKEVLNYSGIDGRRISMSYCTAAEGQKFQQEAIKFDKQINELGPSPIRIKSDAKTKAKA